ncbi:MAG: hypothetical protein WA581_12385 [Candidatus Acidiferrales bacterium]
MPPGSDDVGAAVDDVDADEIHLEPQAGEVASQSDWQGRGVRPLPGLTSRIQMDGPYLPVTGFL